MLSMRSLLDLGSMPALLSFFDDLEGGEDVRWRLFAFENGVKVRRSSSSDESDILGNYRD